MGLSLCGSCLIVHMCAYSVLWWLSDEVYKEVTKNLFLATPAQRIFFSLYTKRFPENHGTVTSFNMHGINSVRKSLQKVKSNEKFIVVRGKE